MNYRPLRDALADIVVKATQKQDFETDVSSLVSCLRQADKDSWVLDINDETIVLTGNGFKQLVTDRLNCPINIFNDKDITPQTRQMILSDKARKIGDKPLVVRRSKNRVDAIVSQQYAYFDNATLVHSISQFVAEKLLPPMEDMYAHTYWSDEGGRVIYMRIISPKHWNYSDNGDTYYSGLSIRNNEFGKGSLSISPALARVSCFNYTVANNTIQENHRWASHQDMLDALRRGVQHVQEFADVMFERTVNAKSVEFNDPKAVFELISQRLKFPSRVKEDTLAYWTREGEDPTAYGIAQAITYGTQATTNVKGRRIPKWDVRETLEHNTWSWTDEILDLHLAGEDVNRYVSEAELISKSKVLTALQGHDEWSEVASLVRDLEPVAYR